MHHMALFAEEGMLLCSLRVTRLGLVLFLWIGGGCLYYHSSCNLRFVSSCKANASHGAVRGRGEVAVQSANVMMRADGRTRAAPPWGQVHGCMYAIRARNDDVVIIPFTTGRMVAMLYTPKMVAHAEMGLFPGGSAQSSKTGRVSNGFDQDVSTQLRLEVAESCLAQVSLVELGVVASLVELLSFTVSVV